MDGGTVGIEVPYLLKNFERPYFTSEGITYGIRAFGDDMLSANTFFYGTKNTVQYWNCYEYGEGDPNEFERVGLKTKYSAMDVATGKMLIPIFDYAGFDWNAKMFIGATYDDEGRTTGIWYYDENGKELAKFDDGTYFDGSGYAFIASGKRLCMVNEDFRRVSDFLKFDKDSGLELGVFGQDGVFTYKSGDNAYFVLYS